MTDTSPRTVAVAAGAPPPPRQRAWLERLAWLRAAAVTEPGRLRIIGAVLAGLVLAFGAVTAWQVSERAAAAENVVGRSGVLSVKAGEIYRSLADANTMATTGFLAGGQDPPGVRRQYEKDISTASRLIAQAATSAGGSPVARSRIGLLSQGLPVYTGLVETARTYNREGLPLGGAYLRYANERMQGKGGLLDAAAELYTIETGRLAADYDAAESLPWAAWGLGAAALAALVWAQRRSYRRTNRVFSRGLLAGTAATAVVLVWLVAGHTVARFELEDSYQHGARSLQVLSTARIQSLQARGDENLTLVSRGSDSYNIEFTTEMTGLAGRNADGHTGLLARALTLADDTTGRGAVRNAMKAAQAWWSLHGTVRAEDNAGSYDQAVAQTIGGSGVTKWTGRCFNGVDTSLATAIRHEQGQFASAAAGGRDALSGLAAGSTVLAVLGGACAALGIRRRLAEYW